jgi:uncharacterized protein YbaP (TraB family)
MRKYFLFLIALFISWMPFGASAQRFVKKSLKSPKSLLWRISGHGLTEPSYVMGTIHLICKDDYFFTAAMDSALRASNQLVLEVNIADPRMLTDFQDSMKLPAGQKLRDFFDSDAEYQGFKTKATEVFGMDISPLEGHKPFLFLSMFATSTFACKEQASYETNLSKQADRLGMHVLGLETFDEQLRLFDNLDRNAMRKLLLESVNESGKNDKTMEKMVGLYKKQDLDGLLQLMEKSPEMNLNQDALLKDRNQRWVERLPAIMQAQSVFVAVGAAHLPGNNGVLQLLRQQGYTVEAVK